MPGKSTGIGGLIVAAMMADLLSGVAASDDPNVCVCNDPNCPARKAGAIVAKPKLKIIDIGTAQALLRRGPGPDGSPSIYLELHSSIPDGPEPLQMGLGYPDENTRDDQFEVFDPHMVLEALEGALTGLSGVVVVSG